MKRPNFTEEQEMWLCGTISEWYKSWEKRIAEGNNKFQWATEELKMKVLGIPDSDIHLNGILCEQITPEDYFTYYNNFMCSVCDDVRHNDYIGVIKHDLSIEGGFEQEGSFVRNIRFCNDNPDCIARAKDKTNWTIINRNLINEKN